MTVKEKAISAINSLDDDATLDDMIERLYLLRKSEIGIAYLSPLTMAQGRIAKI